MQTHTLIVLAMVTLVGMPAPLRAAPLLADAEAAAEGSTPPSEELLGPDATSSASEAAEASDTQARPEDVKEPPAEMDATDLSAAKGAEAGGSPSPVAVGLGAAAGGGVGAIAALATSAGIFLFMTSNDSALAFDYAKPDIMTTAAGDAMLPFVLGVACVASTSMASLGGALLAWYWGGWRTALWAAVGGPVGMGLGALAGVAFGFLASAIAALMTPEPPRVGLIDGPPQSLYRFGDGLLATFLVAAPLGAVAGAAAGAGGAAALRASLPSSSGDEE